MWQYVKHRREESEDWDFGGQGEKEETAREVEKEKPVRWEDNHSIVSYFP